MNHETRAQLSAAIDDAVETLSANLQPLIDHVVAASLASSQVKQLERVAQSARRSSDFAYFVKRQTGKAKVGREWLFVSGGTTLGQRTVDFLEKAVSATDERLGVTLAEHRNEARVRVLAACARNLSSGYGYQMAVSGGG